MKKIDAYNKLSKYYAFADIPNLEIYNLVEANFNDKNSLKEIEDKLDAIVGSKMSDELIDKFMVQHIHFISQFRSLKDFLDKHGVEFNIDKAMMLLDKSAHLNNIISVEYNNHRAAIEDEQYQFINNDEFTKTFFEAYQLTNIADITPVITTDEEIMYDSTRAYINKLNQPLLTREEEIELFNRYRNGDVSARDKIVASNLRLVVNVVKKYCGRGLEMDDLIQEGNSGLLTAIEKFDVDKGYKFSTYAVWWIRQAATRALANDGRTIRLPVHVTEKVFKYKRFVEEFTRTNRRMPTRDEIAKALGCSKDYVMGIEQCLLDPVSIYTPIGEEEDTELGDFIEDPKANAIEDLELKEAMATFINQSSLTEREKFVIYYRFGFDGYGSQTLESVGSRLGITRERVRQIEAKALRKLRYSRNAGDVKVFLTNELPEPAGPIPVGPTKVKKIK